MKVLAIAVVLSTLACSAPASANDTDPDTVGRQLRAVSREINRNLPLQIDAEKRLDATAVIGETLIFKYTFLDERVINQRNWSSDRYGKALLAGAAAQYCMDRAMRALLRSGAAINYVMVTASGQKVVDVTVNERNCAGPKSR